MSRRKTSHVWLVSPTTRSCAQLWNAMKRPLALIDGLIESGYGGWGVVTEPGIFPSVPRELRETRTTCPVRLSMRKISQALLVSLSTRSDQALAKATYLPFGVMLTGLSPFS